MKYILQMVETDIQGNETLNTVTHSFHADTLSTVLEKTQDFLKGCGFVFNGIVDIVSEEEYYGLDDHVELTELGKQMVQQDEWSRVLREDAQAEGAELHSKHYYDTERNK